METAAPPATDATMGETATVSVHSAKAVTAGDPAEASPAPTAIEGREGSMMSVSTEAHNESQPEEARDEPAEPAAEEEAAAEPNADVEKK